MKYLILSIIITLQFTLLAQKPPVKWKEIPMEDLQMNSYHLDTSASAVVLCDYGQYYFDLNPNGQNLFLFYSQHVRIKILKPEGVKYAHINLLFNDMTCQKLPQENSVVIKAITYNLSKNGKIEASKLKGKTIKYKDTANCITIAEFDMPNVKVGSVIDYMITKPGFDFLIPKSWIFQWDIPVVHSELRMRVPRYFQYMFTPANFENFDFVDETDYTHTLMFNTRYYYQRNFLFDMSGKQMQFIKKNVEAFNNQNFTINPEIYRQKLNIHLFKATNEIYGGAWNYITHTLFTTLSDGYENLDPIQRRTLFYPAGYILYTLPDWEKMNQKLLNSDRFGLPLIKHWEYQPYLNNMIKDKETDFDKMLAIYNHLRENMKWSGVSDIYVQSVFNPDLSKIYTKITKRLIKEKSLSKPFQKNEGSSSEINFILISLLNKAGIETQPVLISTRNNSPVDVNIPEPRQFNQVIALATIGNEQYLLDATDSLRPYNLLDKNQIGRKGFLVDGKDFGWIDIKNKIKTSTTIEERITIDENLTVDQKLTLEKSGYEALEMRKSSTNSIEKIKEAAGIELGNTEILEIKNADNEELPLIIKAHNKSEFKGKLEILPKLKATYSENDFGDSFRQFPVEFEFPYSKTYILELKLAEGISCKIPENSSYNTYGGNAYFTYQSNREGNNVKVVIQVEIKKTDYPASEYENLKHLYTALNELLKESIIVEKIVD